MYTIEQTEVFERWFARLRDTMTKRRILARVRNIELHGHFGDHKSVGANVFELRFHYGPGYRVYYTVRGQEIVLLLAGGDKDGQSRDIEKAIGIVEEMNDDD